MRLRPLVLIAAGVSLLAGCAERPLPTYEPPLARTQIEHVRTTAYFDGEADHRPYTNHNALGTTLQYGAINSAAADWSRWPAGTMFRILQTGRTYLVDDYGWDLAGRNTLDLYMPTRYQMDQWGLQYVDIEILRWGDPHESYKTLLPRSGYRHVRRMLTELRPELNDFPVATYNPMPAMAAAPAQPYSAPVATAVYARPQRVTAQPAGNNVALTPFY